MGQVILVILFIALCIAVPPIGIGVLIIIIVWIIGAIYKAHQKKKNENTEFARKQELVSEVRQSLQKDRELLVSTIVATIKKHWHVLEDKLEQHADEDDYGNKVINNRFRQDMVYFSEKVVLPALEHCINSGETDNKNLILILADTTRIFTHIDESWFDIKFDNTNTEIAKKLLASIDYSVIDDDILNTIYTDAVFMEDPLAMEQIREQFPDEHNVSISSTVIEPYIHGIEDVYMRQSLITFSFQGDLKASNPIEVPSFIGLVFVLFSAMHNTKKNVHKSNKRNIATSFVGNDPYKYEEYIKELLRSDGFSAKRTRGSGDYGVDVIASKDGITYAIQCKLYNHTVGTKAVQEIVSGRIFYRADFAIVVSDNSFTDAAKTLARRSDVILVHHKNLLHKIDEQHKKIVPAHNELDDKVNQPHGQTGKVSHKQLINDIEVAEEYKRRETDELITVVLPTIRND